MSKEQNIRDRKVIEVDGDKIRSLLRESWKSTELSKTMFSDFPQTLEEFLSSNPIDLVKMYDRSAENIDDKYKVPAPVRFYLVKRYGLWYKNLEMPKDSSSILSLEDHVSCYINWEVRSVVEDKIKIINRSTKPIYKKAKVEFKRKMANIKR